MGKGHRLAREPVGISKQPFDHFQPLGDRSAASPELLHGHIHNALVVVANMLLKDRYRALHAGLAATEVQVNRGGQIGMAQGVDQELIQDVHTAAVRQTAAGFLHYRDNRIYIRIFVAGVDLLHGPKYDLAGLRGGTHAGGHHSHEVSGTYAAVLSDVGVEGARG